MVDRAACLASFFGPEPSPENAPGRLLAVSGARAHVEGAGGLGTQGRQDNVVAQIHGTVMLTRKARKQEAAVEVKRFELAVGEGPYPRQVGVHADAVSNRRAELFPVGLSRPLVTIAGRPDELAECTVGGTLGGGIEAEVGGE